MATAVIAVLAALLGAAAAAWQWWQREPAATPLDAHWTGSALALAGDGAAGYRDGPSDHAQFSDPFGIAIDGQGTIYVADAGDANAIRRITRDGTVSTLAGGTLGFADGSGRDARFNSPSGLAIDGQGVLYVADTGNNAVRRITPDGRVATLAGTGQSGYRDGPGVEAQFNGPIGVAVDARGRVIVADTYNDRIRAIEPDGTVTTIAGGAEPGLLDHRGSDARFDTPSGVAIDPAGNIVVADTGNDLVRVIAPSGDVSSRVPTLDHWLVHPIGIAVGPSGEIYVTDERGRVIAGTAPGEWRVLAGSTPGFADGDGASARFRRPAGVALAGPGRAVVADGGNALVRLVYARAYGDVHLPASPLIAPSFDPDAFAQVALLWPVDPLEGPHEIAGTLGEARGGEGSERFHAGIDVRVDEGTPVRAVRAGVVAAPLAANDFGSLNESVRIGTIAYIHLRVGRTRQKEIIDASQFVPTLTAGGVLSRIRIKRGARFATGDVIGTVNPFNHVHLNVGWPGEEYNPLRFGLVQFADSVPPTIAPGGIRLFDESGQPLKKRDKGRLLVSGAVHVVVDAWDQADGNRPNRRLGLYSLGFQVLHADGTPAPGFEQPRQTITFDRLGLDPEAARLVYAPGSGIPFYGRRATRFLYSVTNSFANGVAAPGVWDATLLPPGEYTLRVIAEDIRGNQALERRDLAITIVPSP
jgi:sugar lactone lactonase YvrE